MKNYPVRRAKDGWMTPKNAACGWRKPPETLSVDQPVDETDSTWTSNFDNDILESW